MSILISPITCERKLSSLSFSENTMPDVWCQHSASQRSDWLSAWVLSYFDTIFCIFMDKKSVAL
jgi:hypothetical protein